MSCPTVIRVVEGDGTRPVVVRVSTSQGGNGSCPAVVRVASGQGPPGIGLPAGTADAGKFVRKLGATPYAYELVTPDAVGLPQGLGPTNSPTFAGLTLSGIAANRLLFTGAGGALAGLSLGSGLSIVDGALTATTSGYPSLTVPTGFSVTGSGTASLAIGFAAGYSLPANTRQAGWDSALTLATAAAPAASLAAVATSGAYADLSGRPDLGLKADLVGGVIPSSQIPAIAISDYLGAVGSQAAMLALIGQRGDWCLRTDSGAVGQWVLSGDNAALLANWVQITAPAAPVQSVNGQVGIVVLGPGDVGAVSATDPRLTDAREWSAATVEQAEAEAGASTTRRAWTAQRVRQAVAAWWAATASAAGQALATAADAAAQRLLLGLSSTDSPTFSGLTVTGTATLEHIHGALAGEVYQHVRADGVPLAALAPYHVVGSQGDTDRALVIAARADSASAMPAAGLVETALSSNGDGHGVVAGVMVGCNTAGLVSGDPVYVAPAGGLTLTRPTTGLVQVVAVVGRVHASTGTLVLAVGPALPAWIYVNTTDAGNLSSGTLAAARLPGSGVSPGAYGSGSQVGTFSVDTYGRLTTAGNQAINILATAISDSSVAGRALLTAASVAAQRTAMELGTAALAAAADLLSRANHTGTQPANTITGLAASATTDTTNAGNISSGTLGAARLPASGVTANTYGSSSQVPVLTVDATGRVTAVTLAPVSGGGGGAVRIDSTSTTNTIYVGKAPAGSAESAAVWDITRTQFSAAGVQTGSGTVSAVTWTGRTSHSYP